MPSTTSGLSNLMQILYDKRFLERAQEMQSYDYIGAQKTMPTNSGRTIFFNRFSPLAKATTPLTEGTNPAGVDMTSTIVSATIAEYGTYTTVSSLFNLTSLDDNLMEHVDVHGQNAAETLDTLIAAELSANSTVQFAGNKSALSSIAATDVLTGAEIRKAVRTLKRNKARVFASGMFRAIVPVSGVYDLRGNAEWLDASRYTDATVIRNGEIGRLHGVEFKETNNESSETSTTTVFHTFVAGDNSLGIVNLAGQPGSRIYVKTPGPQDTSNPLDLRSTVGWKAFFVAKVLNSSWVVNIKHGVTA